MTLRKHVDLPELIRRHQQWLELWSQSSSSADEQQLLKHTYRGSLKWVDIPNLDLSQLNLERILAGYSHIPGINFAGSSLRHADFFGASMRNANFQDADLSRSDLSSANLHNVNFLGADLTGCSIRQSNLCGARFDHNIVRCASFSRSIFSPDALPWLALHPRWGELRLTVNIVEH